MKKDILLIIKSIGYRIFGTLATIIISFIFTGSVKISISIGIFEVLSKIILYYVYEKIWQGIMVKINEKNI